MKPHGSKFEYENERDADLLRAFNQLVTQAKRISCPEIYGQLVNMPSKRFWVSEERATIVISSMLKGNKLDGMRPCKKEMFYEIYRRVLKMREEKPSLSIPEIVFNVLRQEAPKFYITPKSAKYLIFYAKKKCFQEKKHKLRHLF